MNGIGVTIAGEVPLQTNYLVSRAFNMPPLDSVLTAAAYSLRRLRSDYPGPAVRVRRSSDNAEQDIWFTDSAIARYPLDSITTPALGAWALRQLRSTATQAVRVRRSSDNLEADIGFTAAGNLDTDALLAHCQMPRVLLDSIQGASAAYSLRRLRTAYTGPAIRVRRSSDNAQQDIGFTAAGNLDTTALLAFSGAGDAAVVTWYDQGPSAVHVTNATDINQPFIVVAGVVQTLTGGRPAVRFTGGSMGLLGASAVPGVQAHMVQETTLTNSGFEYFAGGPTGIVGVRTTSNERRTGSLAAGIVSGADFASGATIVYTDTLTLIRRNGADRTMTANAISNAAPTVEIGSRNSATGFIGLIAELIFFSAQTSTGDRQSVEQSQCNYYGATYAVPYTSGFVSTLYDQSGAGRHATQASAEAQPRIVNAGVIDVDSASLPTLVFSGAQWLTVAGFSPDRSQFTNLTVNAVYQATDISTGTRTLWGADNGGWDRFQLTVFGAPNTAAISDGTFTVGVPAMNNLNRHIYTATLRTGVASGSSVRIDGAQSVAFTESIGSAHSTFAIGAINSAGANLLLGTISSMVVFGAALSSNDRLRLEQSQASYYGIAYAQTLPPATAAGVQTRLNRNPNWDASTAVVGSPGALPTGWQWIAAPSGVGLSSEIVSVGTEQGLPYVDLRVFGTTTISGIIRLQLHGGQIVVGNDVRAGASASLQLVAGSLANTFNPALSLTLRSNAGAFLTGVDATGTITNILQRFAVNRNTNITGGPTCDRACMEWRHTVAASAAVDYTLRIAVPNMVVGSFNAVRPLLSTAIEVVSPIGGLDLDAIDAWVGGSNAQIAGWYDQSSNERHAFQATAANQPQLVNSGLISTSNGRPTVIFDRTALTTLITPAAFSAVGVSAVLAASTLSFPPGLYVGIVGFSGVSSLLFGTPGSSSSMSSVAGLPRINAVAGANAAPLTSLKVGHAQSATIYTGQWSLGRGDSGLNVWSGPISEIILLETPNSVAERATIERSQGSFYTIPVA